MTLVYSPTVIKALTCFNVAYSFNPMVSSERGTLLARLDQCLREMDPKDRADYYTAIREL